MEFEISKITSRGQIVIPQGIRKRGSIREGERFLVYSTGDSIVLKRVKNLEATKNLKEFENVFKSMWKTAKKKGITREDVRKEVEVVRREKEEKNA